MTPEEDRLILNVGQVLVQDIVIVLPKAVLYGTYVVLSTMAMRNLWNRGLKTKPTLIPFLALAVIFIAFTLSFATNIALLIEHLQALVGNADQSLKARVMLVMMSAATRALHIVDECVDGNSTGVLFWIGDAVVVWRACVMFPGHTKTRCGLIFLLTSGIVLSISSNTLQILDRINDQSIAVNSAGGILQLTCTITFILVNALATGLFARQTYNHRRFLKAAIGNTRSMSVKIMVLLVESGAVYLSIQIVAVVLTFTDNSIFTLHDIFFRIWDPVRVFASAIYPVAVILIVDRQRSIADTPGLTEIISNAGLNVEFATASFTRSETASLSFTVPSDFSSESASVDLEKGVTFFEAMPQRDVNWERGKIRPFP